MVPPAPRDHGPTPSAFWLRLHRFEVSAPATYLGAGVFLIAVLAVLAVFAIVALHITSSLGAVL